MHVDPDVSVLPLEAELDTPGWQFAVAGGILGWVLDAFDFFVVVFLFNELMAKFHPGKPAIVWSLSRLHSNLDRSINLSRCSQASVPQGPRERLTGRIHKKVCRRQAI
jgi:hypothetical protein